MYQNELLYKCKDMVSHYETDTTVPCGDISKGELNQTGAQPPAVTAFGLRCILQEKSFNSKLYGNEVYCTNALLSLIKIMLCSKLPCIKVLKLKLCSCKICWEGGAVSPLAVSTVKSLSLRQY